ncbi:hypothetical protein [Sulfurimonas sp.]|uniref:hypothetical protein n=1 Tax=Sulfurimonas sp. TaxID=2022749 RepID=UPI0025DFB317|nr:hypothetical protein [Sulfurimonas sp.]
MNILSSPLYEKQLKELLNILSKQDYQATKNFKMYLDTIILNMPSKEKNIKSPSILTMKILKILNFKDVQSPF